MARTDARGGPQTRARIAEIAAGLFAERGYDAVTVADVARAAGVSSQTVFNHFPRKEDLFLDRGDEAATILREAIREREPGTDALTALQEMTNALLAAQHPLSGADPRSTPFFRTLAGSPALIARAREIAAGLQAVLADELRHDETFEADAQLLAAFFVAGYATVLAQTARRLIDGEPVTDHTERFARMFDALRQGLESGLESGLENGAP
ncbi:TetR family transcriptional regulator [Microbacteriaceae bacterium VKM Ac-2854]|nr:TetR family transcriptional regulator [Microbacteriaceae bacterium VKM Ac-2854]